MTCPGKVGGGPHDRRRPFFYAISVEKSDKLDNDGPGSSVAEHEGKGSTRHSYESGVAEMPLPGRKTAAVPFIA
jgi:hypothetical protein